MSASGEDVVPAMAAPVARRGSAGWTVAARNAGFGYILMLPSIFFFLLLIAYPLVQTFWISLYHMSTLTRRGEFVGLANYRALLSSAEFWDSFARSLVWTVVSLALQLCLGVGFALLLNVRLTFRPVARALVLFPYLLSTVVAVLIWQWLFNDMYGYLNYVIQEFGLSDSPVNWLGQSPNALISTLLVAGWKNFPFVTIAVLARLQGIPTALYDAARIDGAGAWSRFRDITLPQLRSVLAMVIILRSIWDFKEFDLIYMMTGGGPRSSTQTLPLMIYNEVFPKLSMGSGAAIAVVMLLIMVAFFWVYAGRYDRVEGERAR